jgi:hypothetical protein
MSSTDREIRLLWEKLLKLEREMETLRAGNARQSVDDHSNKQLAVISKSEVKDIAVAVSNEVSKKVYNNVMAHISREVVPQIKSAVELINYRIGDTEEMIMEHRMGEMRAAEKEAPKSIGYGGQEFQRRYLFE